MKIVVQTTLRDKIKGVRFFVRLFRNGDLEQEYRGKYEEGAWEFELYDGENMVLRCERVRLPARDTFLRRQAYTIFYGSEELCQIKKGFFNRTIIWDGREYGFPGLFRARMSEIGLRFPRWSLIWRFRVRSYCDAKDEKKIMLAIVITILVWLTWNALSAD